MTLVFIRHGATAANREHRYLGRTDEALSREGRASLLLDRSGHRYPEATHVFTSPMKRCIETAGILYPQLEPVVIPEWTEMDFGRFEYRNYQELQGDSQYQAWIDSGGMGDFPEGEGRGHFQLRCQEGFVKMWGELERIQEGTSGPVTLGLIVHGGTIMALMSAYAGGEYFDYQVPNGGGYVCRLLDGGQAPKLWKEREL